MRRVVLARLSVKLVLRCGTIPCLNREYNSEGATPKSTARNEYRETAGDAHATVRYALATG